MQEMSDEFNDIVENGNALYHITITRVRDNEILDLPIDNFKYIGVKCADDNITFGNAPCQSVTFSIHNPEINLENEELFIQQGLYLEDDTLENIDLGYFTVQKPTSDGEVTQYVCYDRMIKFEKIFYIPGDYPTTYTVNGILYEIERATGIKINPFPSSVDYRLAKTMFNGIYTMREMLGYLGGIIGKDAIVNRAGEVEFKWYTSVDGYTLDGSRIYQGATNIETEYDMYIEKIVCSVSVPGSSTRKVVVGTGDRIVYVSNPFMHDYMLAAIYERIRNFRYRGITAEFLGDFRLDLGDVINVTKGNETYRCCVMEISHQSDGGVRTTISSHNKTEREQEVNVTGSVTRSIDKLNEHARDYGIDIDSEKISLVEDKSKNSIPLATEEMIDNIPINGNCINTPMIYSTDEKKVGVWIDGKSIYQKTIHISQLPNSSILEIDPNVNNLYEIIDFNGYCRPKDKISNPLSTTRPLPNVGGGNNDIRVDSQEGKIRIVTYSDWSTYEAYLTIMYTKTTD